METDARVAVDLAALNAVVDALARCGRMDSAEMQLERATELCRRKGVFSPPVLFFTCLLPATCLHATSQEGLNDLCIGKNRWVEYQKIDDVPANLYCLISLDVP